jgi:tetratricopeptide (TPR) repeat protein
MLYQFNGRVNSSGGNYKAEYLCIPKDVRILDRGAFNDHQKPRNQEKGSVLKKERKTKSMPRCFMAAALIMLIGSWSCVSTPPVSPARQWSCDPQADQTVTEGQWQRALMQHQAYLTDHPGNCLAMYHLGYIHGRLGDHEKEIDLYQRAVQCGYDADDQLFFNLGMALVEFEQTESALTALERAVALDPGNAENHFGLGLAAASAGRLDLAMSALTKAVAVDPRHWDARLELARIELEQGRLEEARLQLEAVQKGAPDSEALKMLWHIYQDRMITTFDTPGK